ncbi:MAG TPA: hypothetical protein VK601_16365 [Kofleriaceae bacterium]|nr:hypothetical protein [Kofleriaceae bacterium]
MRWVRRGAAIAALVIGWVFIAWQNQFHISAPVVFVCLGYLAVIATIYNLWRTGAAAVDSGEDGTDSTWAKPVGALGELEREKRTLLKAIKEAEFDHQMGKLSQRDADEMIRGYRVRAIEVIKEIDRLGLGTAGSVREQILREVRARVQLEGKTPKKAAAEAKAAGKPGVAGKPAVAAPAAASAGATPAPAAARDVPAGVAAEPAEARATDAAPEAGRARPAERDVPRDDELDADSTTAPEPRRDDSAKEATP